MLDLLHSTKYIVFLLHKQRWLRFLILLYEKLSAVCPAVLFSATGVMVPLINKYYFYLMKLSLLIKFASVLKRKWINADNYIAALCKVSPKLYVSANAFEHIWPKLCTIRWTTERLKLEQNQSILSSHITCFIGVHYCWKVLCS